MFWKKHRDKPKPADAPRTPAANRPVRDIAAEDADSPASIPINPPRNDGS
jgi:hypothetical protein